MDKIKRLTQQLANRLDKTIPAVTFEKNNIKTTSKRPLDESNSQKTNDPNSQKITISPPPVQIKKKFRAIIAGLPVTNYNRQHGGNNIMRTSSPMVTDPSD